MEGSTLTTNFLLQQKRYCYYGRGRRFGRNAYRRGRGRLLLDFYLIYLLFLFP